ncbi:hypothetical protein A2872_00205 [Candidatus Gottesmanbacteria bacterium RIFCSPHIGHO2_01_FULL_42_12]|uniref:DNA-binding response regulator n=1 Tax=Candidatus Gottesmanbacteria bacterium RIFCSPHIGHO2_01_FULL_42_12 TaxID=1798377 RepID=A0A1F5YZF0_9BACT|nr:MAG: hypothetical protein A2872_00205 [Candidatus Gottesmanbacteria bacterium RIFCSPHIGHO2_01_FULL_42_12]
MTAKIFLIDDDLDFQKYVKDLLGDNGYVVTTATQGSTAIRLLNKTLPDLVLLDLSLPDMEGESVCKEIRKDYPDIPIIILTAKNSTVDKVRGLNIGADDYVTKPIVPEELMARIKARLRPQNKNQGYLKVDNLELDPKKVEVRRDGKLIPLTPHEFKLLELLMNNKDIVLSREQILNRIWDYSMDVESRVVDVYMGYLRKKIDNGYKKPLIHSIRGFGYTIKD